jgi:GntR family transcriptional repressor for pyruvate dehydrogenase complex
LDVSDKLDDRQERRRVTRGRVADQILEDLRDQIASGVLPRGAKLPAEAELARRYGVSGATAREAMRGLTAMGLIEVRHGSGGTVTAAGDTVLGAALGTLVQIESASIGDILGILGALNVHAAELAAENATDDDLAAIEAAIDDLATARDIDGLTAALIRFLHALSAAARSPILAALCRFLAELQLELALDLSRRSLTTLRRMIGSLSGERVAILQALRARDRVAAAAAARNYQSRAQALIAALPYGNERRSLRLAGALSAMTRRRHLAE